MGFAFKRWALVGAVSGFGVVFAASAYAGYAWTPAVYIDNTNHTAEGSFVGARTSGNSVEYIGVTINDFAVTYYAQDASGTYRSCGHPGAPGTTERIEVSTISNQSWFRFKWDPNTGYCVAPLDIQNNSFMSSP